MGRWNLHPFCVLVASVTCSSAMGQACCASGGRAALLKVAAQPTVPQVAKPSTTDAPKPGMVWIPGGEFSMGCDSKLARPDEQPIHRVRVNGFWMDQTLSLIHI